MITIEDCYGFCDLDQEAIDAIASHEHLNDIVAIELAQSLIKRKSGIRQVHSMIEDDIHWAQFKGQTDRVNQLSKILAAFDKKYGAL